MKNLKLKKWFTLIEIVTATTLFFLILVNLIAIYNRMLDLKTTIQVKQSLVQNAYTIMERMQWLIKDYTIDYEEYFNRRTVGCDDALPSTYSRNVQSGSANGHCDLFTQYGNSNSFLTNTSDRGLYYCSSTGNNQTDPKTVIVNTNLTSQEGCRSPAAGSWFQSYGQYALQFLDALQDVDFAPGPVGDNDDLELWDGPDSFTQDQTWWVQELYLISKDHKKRILIRRSLIESWDRNWDGIIGNVATDNLFTLQILKLTSFDAGTQHNFDPNSSSGVFDWAIDTRACDLSQGFICNGTGVGPVFSGYKLPSDADDGRAPLFGSDLTISDRYIQIEPTKDSSLAYKNNAAQINPTIKLVVTFQPYWRARGKRLTRGWLDQQQLTLQTTFAIKTHY